MVKRIGGTRRKTRHKMSKNVRDKGKISIQRYLQDFKTGEKICLVTEPAVHKGLFHSRFHGKAGTIIGKRGNCYEVEIKDIKMLKTLVVHPSHLKRM